jgi:hypothetical protein
MDDMQIDMEMPPLPKRKPDFETRWVKVDRRWRKALRGCAGSTYELALTILFEDYKREQRGGDFVVLSKAVTGMSHSTRTRAADELAELGLIKIIRKGNHALRVSVIIIKERKERKE